MPQYFELLSQNDGNLEQTHQFFNGNQENEQTQVRYILADDSSQFRAQQLILSTDQVMLVDGSQQQIQGVVIDQGHAFQSSSQQQQQFGTVNMNNQSTQHIFYMETSNGQSGDDVAGIQAVIEQGSQTPPQAQPIVLNHQMGTNNLPASNRQVLQGSAGSRPVLQIRTPLRQGLVQVSQQQPRSLTSPSITLPQQVRHQQPAMRPLPNQQVQMRVRSSSVPQIRLPAPQQVQQSQPQQQRAAPLGHLPAKNPLPSFSRQMNVLHQKQLQQQQQQQQQVVVQQQQQQQQQGSTQTIVNQIQKGLSEFQRQQIKNGQEEELDDHDPAMNSSPGQMVNYKKLLEQRQQIGKNPILARLPSNIKVTSSPVSHRQQQQQPQQQPNQPSSVTQTIDQVVNQVSQAQQQQQPQQLPVNNPPTTPQKKPRGSSRAKNPQAASRSPGGAAARQRMQRVAIPQPPQFAGPRAAAPPTQQPRFPLGQQQPPQRFPSNQQQLMQRAPLTQQQQHTPQPPQPPVAQQQQNGLSNQSQMNYLITPPTANRPRQQRPLPSYIPSSQIQQIIESTPLAEEFSDSIRMLVLLENGEQRLITFTLPKEACTIQEILEQVNVPFTPETNIQVTEANTNGINYIVTVGNVSNFTSASPEDEQQETSESSEHLQANQFNQKVVQTSPPELPKPPTPDPPKLVPGKLAVCTYCGYTSEDFNKCARCTRKMPDDVKSIDTPVKMDLFQKTSSNDASIFHSSGKSNDSALKEPAKPSSPTKKKTGKSKPVENEAVVISSDEEDDDEKKAVRSVSEQLLNKLGASISICPVTKEPSLTDIKKHQRKLSVEPLKCYKLPLKCRTVRIGSYRFMPSDNVILDSKCVIIKAPMVDNKTEIKTIRIDRGDVVKVLACFNKALPVIFYYLNVGAAPIIRDMLNLKKESGLYFDPVDEKEDSYRKITLLPEDLLDDQKNLIQQIYGVAPYNVLEELTAKEANDILIKACPKDSASGIGSFSEIKQILMYPKEGQGRLSINTEDYVCLAVDQFLNDKIIDFYLKYLWENLPQEMQDKVHIFSTFFYKRLTTKPSKKSHPFESDGKLTAAEKRHLRVKNWTKRINIFDKDFIIVPINENAHWFLAIICFPGLSGPETFDGKPYIPAPKVRRARTKQPAEVKKDKPIPCDDPLLSDKDEAESEDSDMESDDSEEAAAAAAIAAAAAEEAAAVAAAEAAAAAAAAAPAPSPQPKGKNAPKAPPIKQPCILIFDSLAGPSRLRVVATLRDYLTVEFKTKMDSERVFNRDRIKGAPCKVPQQNNFTDCGLYLLQYVEQFFKEPIKDFNTPIKGIDNWFEEIVVTKKREDICNLLKKLMVESGGDVTILPDIALPTLNGKLIERPEPEHDPETGEEEQEDMFTDIEDSEMTDTSSLNTSRVSEENGACKGEECQENSSGGENSSQGSFHASPIKPSDSSIDEKSDIVANVMKPAVLKPTLSEFPRQTTNKSTLDYLKSKRIARHKPPSDGPELKKSKLDDN